MSKMLRIYILLALILKVTACYKLCLEIHDFDIRAQKNVISDHFKIFDALYRVSQKKGGLRN
jgi:hypothetical protein